MGQPRRFAFLLLGPSAACCILLHSPAARSQSATPLERLSPAPAGDSFVAVPSAGVADAPRISAAALLSYAKSPLRLRGADGAQVGAVVSHQLTGHLLVSLEVARRLKLDLAMPLVLSQSGDNPTIATTTFASPTGTAVGDLRLGARFELLEQVGYAPSASLGLQLFAPTGDDAAYAGAGRLRWSPSIVVGADYERAVWAASVSHRSFPGDVGGLMGADVSYGLGVAAKLGRFQIGPELYGSLPVEQPPTWGASLRGAHEALFAGRVRVGPVRFTAGAGGAFSKAVGSPEFRAVLGIGFEPEVEAEPPAPPPQPEAQPRLVPAYVVGSGGAELSAGKGSDDRDGDGVPDSEDRCIDVVGDANAPPERKGCPPDSDGDGVPDATDRCPSEKGPPSLDPAKNGCPQDTDGDGIPDDVDACPREQGPKTDDPKTTGCPRSVRVEKGQIVILQQVNFKTGSDIIESSSNELLTQVADALKQHPEIARIAVDGHTDNRGAERSNVELSRRRAAAVMRWLVGHGVDPRRVEARGFGPKRPIADNRTEDGKAKNRRVEFQILKRTEQGESGWKDGPLQ